MKLGEWIDRIIGLALLGHAPWTHINWHHCLRTSLNLKEKKMIVQKHVYEFSRKPRWRIVYSFVHFKLNWHSSTYMVHILNFLLWKHHIIWYLIWLNSRPYCRNSSFYVHKMGYQTFSFILFSKTNKHINLDFQSFFK